MTANTPQKEKAPAVLMTTPVGELLWPKLTVPDAKFDPEGVYTTKIRLQSDNPDVVAFIQELSAHAEAAYDRAKMDNPKLRNIRVAAFPFTDELDENGNVTGNTLVHTKMKAKGTTKAGRSWEQRPSLFDRHNNPYEDGKVDPWNGTIGRVSFEIIPFFTPSVGAGISLRLRAVQIIKLVEGTAGVKSAEDYGFSPLPSEEDENMGEDGLPF